MAKGVNPPIKISGIIFWFVLYCLVLDMMPEQLPAQTWLAARPNVYELLNRSVVPHGKQLCVLLHEAMDASTTPAKPFRHW
jgi:hypothetical protein